MDEIIFFVLMAALLYPPWAARLPVFSMARRGDAVVGLFILAGGLSAMGFVADDLFQIEIDLVRRAPDGGGERSEMLGAAAFFASAGLGLVGTAQRVSPCDRTNPRHQTNFVTASSRKSSRRFSLRHAQFRKVRSRCFPLVPIPHK